MLETYSNESHAFIKFSDLCSQKEFVFAFASCKEACDSMPAQMVHEACPSPGTWPMLIS